MAYDKKLTRGLQSTIDATYIEDGKIRFAVDTGRLFLDVKHERVEITDFIRGLTRDEIMNLENPLPKMYLSSDSHELLFYHAGAWSSFGGGSADGLGQLIHTTYIKGIKFENNDMVLIKGDDSEYLIEDSIFPSIIQRLTDLEEKYNALLEATTKWGNFDNSSEGE